MLLTNLFISYLGKQDTASLETKMEEIEDLVVQNLISYTEYQN
ncbi:MAG: hypothetical protein AB8U91_00935 [Candidatus Midichloria sp.]